jgi:hypothetical protein
MTISLYAASVPVLKQMLNSVSDILRKAEDYAVTKNIDPQALLQARLYPDMFPLVRQVQLVGDFARAIPARLSGTDVPKHPDTETSFAELQTLLAETIAYLDGYTPAQIDGNESREIVLRAGTPNERKMQGLSYLLHFGLPQFFFHVTTTYAILRHNGLDIGKRNYMGAY